MTKVMIWLIDHRMAFVAYLLWALLTPVAIVIGASLGVAEAMRDWTRNLDWIRQRAAQKGQP